LGPIAANDGNGAPATAQEKNANSDRCLWSWALAAFRVSPSRADEGRRGPPQLTAAELICQFVVLIRFSELKMASHFPLGKAAIAPIFPPGMKQALIALEDGRIFYGEPFGTVGRTVGESCFNTTMTGYQEVLTDPSYRGQIVTMTYPLIGNYGVNELDDESIHPHVRGFVVGELSSVTSNWRASGSLDDYLKRWNICAIQGVDTRALTKHLRTRGAMNACITTERNDPNEVVQMAKNAPAMIGSDYVKEVTTKKVFEWDPTDELSREWTLVKGGDTDVGSNGQAYKKLSPVRHRIVAYDYGIKFNILRRLRQHGFKVTVVPATTTAESVLGLKPD